MNYVIKKIDLSALVLILLLYVRNICPFETGQSTSRPECRIGASEFSFPSMTSMNYQYQSIVISFIFLASSLSMLIAYQKTPIFTTKSPYMVFPYLLVFYTTVSHFSQSDTSDLLAYISGTPESKHRGRLEDSSLKAQHVSLVYSHSLHFMDLLQ